MKLNEAKEQFVSTWGALGTNWGINGTMARIHALLLTSDESLTTEDVMEQLKISRGNANMNIRALMDWELVFKVIISGERKEYFRAEKDIYKVFLRIIRERRKRELQPVLVALGNLKAVDNADQSDKAKEFRKVLGEVEEFTKRADNIAEKIIRAEESKLLSTFLKILK
jgi:DNA-binding transcriptional regulator GbsR (MarR family)